jgi:predicted nucleic acid-binding protein
LRKQNGKESRYILDSSALIAFFDNEDGAGIIQNLLEEALRKEAMIFCSFASYMEVFYITYQKGGKGKARDLIDLMDKLQLERIDSSKEFSLTAGELKASYKISFADSWIAATALMLDAILVHKDPEFDVLEDDIRMLKLPYKISRKEKS